MTFKQASNFMMPLGKYRGQKLDEIAQTDEGLKYLDWLIGQDWVQAPLKTALEAYLSDESISRELSEM